MGILWRSEEHTSELQSLRHLVCRLLLEKFGGDTLDQLKAHIKDALGTGGFYGNIMALFCAFSFSAFVIILRQYRNIDMMPVNLISGILILIVSFVISLGNLNVPIQDILLCFFVLVHHLL